MRSLFRVLSFVGLGLVVSGIACSADPDATSGNDFDPPIPAVNGACDAARRLCGDQCVDPRDPNFGCGTCTACAIGHAKSKCEAATNGVYACSIAACDPGFANCNKFPSDGCEVEVAADANNCGACGAVCGGQGSYVGACKAGVCGKACAAGSNDCNGQCVKESGDSCGPSCTKCTVPANATAVCNSAKCDFTCNAGFARCGSGCCAACGNTAGLQAGSPWPMEGRCPTKIGRAAVNGATTLTYKWAAPDANTPASIAADGTIYYGGFSAKLYAVTPQGAPKWSAPLDGTPTSTPAIAADGTVYVTVSTGSSTGKLQAISSAGAPLWSVSVGNYPPAPAIGGDGTIYVAASAMLKAIDKTGVEKWSTPIGNGQGGNTGRAPAIANDGTIYAATAQLYAVSPSGAVKWVYPANPVSAVGPPVVAPDDGVFALIHNGNTSRVMTKLDANGKPEWGASADNIGFLRTDPVAVAGNGKMYVAGYVFGVGNRLFELAPSVATPLAAPVTGAGAGNDIGMPSLGADDAIYVYTMNKKSSTVTENRVSRVVNGAVTSSTSIAAVSGYRAPSIGGDGTIYLVANDHNLYAFGP